MFGKVVQSRCEGADENAEEGKTADSLIPASNFLEDDRVRSEEHVEGSVDNGHVDTEEKDDGFGEEHDPGTGEGCFEGAEERGFAFPSQIRSADVDIAGYLGKFCCSSTQEDRCVSFW